MKKYLMFCEIIFGKLELLKEILKNVDIEKTKHRILIGQ